MPLIMWHDYNRLPSFPTLFVGWAHSRIYDFIRESITKKKASVNSHDLWRESLARLLEEQGGESQPTLPSKAHLVRPSSVDPSSGWAIHNKMSDPTSQSNFTQISTSNVDFKWKVDFSKKILSGSVTHTLTAHESGVKEVVYAAPSSAY